MATYELYWRSPIRICLKEMLDEMIINGSLTRDLAIQVVVQFDKSITAVLENQVKSKVIVKVLAIFMLSDFLSGWNIFVLEKAVNHNLLGYFILANVLTGVVNLSVDTLSASPLKSFSKLVGYAAMLSAVSMTAMSIGIKLKFW